LHISQRLAQGIAVAKTTTARTISAGMVCPPSNSRYCTRRRAFFKALASERGSFTGHVVVDCLHNDDGREDLHLIDLSLDSPTDEELTTNGKNCDPSF